MENNIAYCIPTYNHPKTIKEVISLVAKMYDDYGFDIYVYDTSENDDTRIIIEEFCNEGIHNLFYIDMDPSINGNEKMVYILSGMGWKKKYDYMGIIKDRAYFDEITMRKVRAESHKDYDAIIMPVAHMPYDVYPQPDTEVYHNQLAFFRDYGALMPNLETVFFRIDSLLIDVDWEEFIHKFFIGRDCCFEQFIALFDGISRLTNPKIRVLREKEVIRRNSLLSTSMWTNQIFYVWAVLWPRAVDLLPSCYNKYKALVKKQETMQPALFGSPYNLLALAQQGILTIEHIEELRDIWDDLSDIPYECLAYIVNNQQNELGTSILIKFNELFSERKYAQLYHMFHVNVWMKKVMGSNHYDILGKCFEIYKLELEHGKETTIFDSVDSYQEAVEDYIVLKYMLRRIEYDVAEEIIDRLIPYFVEHSISAEYLSYLIKCECFDTNKVVNAWEALVNLYQKEHKREL